MLDGRLAGLHGLPGWLVGSPGLAGLAGGLADWLMDRLAGLLAARLGLPSCVHWLADPGWLVGMAALSWIGCLIVPRLAGFIG